MCGPYGWWALEHGHSHSIALLWQGWRVCKARQVESKAFFFEKKKQKTFIPAVACSSGKGLSNTLLLLLYKKEGPAGYVSTCNRGVRFVQQFDEEVARLVTFLLPRNE